MDFLDLTLLDVELNPKGLVSAMSELQLVLAGREPEWMVVGAVIPGLPEVRPVDPQAGLARSDVKAEARGIGGDDVPSPVPTRQVLRRTPRWAGRPPGGIPIVPARESGKSHDEDRDQNHRAHRF